MKESRNKKSVAALWGWMILSLVAPPAVFADDRKLALDELLKEANERNPRILSAQKMAEAARARVPQARAWEDPLALVEKGQGNMHAVGVEQMFPFPGKLSRKGEVARAGAESAGRMLDRTILEVLVEVKHAFHHLSHWHQKIEVNMENQDILQRFVKIAEARYLVGKAGQEDVLKAQVEVGRLANELVLLNRMKAGEEANLSRLLNREESTTWPRPEPVPMPAALTLSEAQLQEMAERSRQEIQAQDASVRASVVSQSLSKLSYAPDFVARAEWWHADGSFGPVGDNWAGMLGVRLPVWFSRKQDYAVREAGAMLESSRAALQDVKNRAKFEVREAFLEVQAAKAQIDVFNSGLLPQAEQDLRVTTASYEAGKADFLRLLESQRALRELRIEYNEAVLGYYMALGDLELAVGEELPAHHGSNGGTR